MLFLALAPFRSTTLRYVAIVANIAFVSSETNMVNASVALVTCQAIHSHRFHINASNNKNTNGKQQPKWNEAMLGWIRLEISEA